MRRRKFIATSTAALAAASFTPKIARGEDKDNGGVFDQENNASVIRPKALRAGDTVGLITPATYVPDPDRLASAERALKYFNLRVKFGKNTGKRQSVYRDSLNERLDDLHAMFRDREVKGVFCVRGGYGSAQLLDRIDYDLIRRNPKVFVGYSDITAMHLAIHKRARLTTFHGPVAVSRFTDYTQASFRKALFETETIGRLTNPPETNQMRPAHPLRTVVAGTATGRLTGGNLTLISTTLGTPYEIDTAGKILFLEDVDEEPYSIDRMLTHLRLAGKFDRVAGVIFGECQDCRPRDYKPSAVSVFSLGETIDNILGGLKVPVLYGLTIGHTDDQLTLPLGAQAVLDATAGTLEIKEAGVVEA